MLEFICKEWVDGEGQWAAWVENEAGRMVTVAVHLPSGASDSAVLAEAESMRADSPGDAAWGGVSGDIMKHLPLRTLLEGLFRMVLPEINIVRAEREDELRPYTEDDWMNLLKSIPRE